MIKFRDNTTGFYNSTTQEGLNCSPEKAALAGVITLRESKTLYTLPPYRTCAALPLASWHQSLTVASRLLEGRSAVCEFGSGSSCGDGWISVQALGHLVANKVNKTFKGLLHVDVVLGAGLKEFKTLEKQVSEDHEVTGLTKITTIWWTFIIRFFSEKLWQLLLLLKVANYFCEAMFLIKSKR